MEMENKHPLTRWRHGHEPKLSQEDLAEKLGVSRWYINRLEVGATSPSFALAMKIEALTGVAPSSFSRLEAAE